MRKLPYKLSDDYDRLKDLLDEGYSVVCVAEYKQDGLMKSVVCEAFLRNKGIEDFEHYLVKVGEMTIATFNPSMVDKVKVYPKTFGEMMKNRNLKFIDIEV